MARLLDKLIDVVYVYAVFEIVQSRRFLSTALIASSRNLKVFTQKETQA